MSMTHLANLRGLFEALPVKPSNFNVEETRRRSSILHNKGNKKEEVQDQNVQLSPNSYVPMKTTRRIVLGLAAAALSMQSGIDKSLADDNGYWVTTPLTVPPIYNKIANEKTGTRSFLKKAVYIADIGSKGSAYRLRKCAFELIALEDLLGQDAWNYVRKYLCLQSTYMYYDFDKVISAAEVSDKQPLTDLANRLFDSVEKLEDAVKARSTSDTDSCYQDTKSILQEVMDRMA
ncbi:hypothetical protein Syun_010239 [Stephania yunnanensis]|uniref:Photosynthetic NDH subcomplex L 3 n=1 Tax=Stephania yunnanensis TaxID=152371 RepID=A0AAP0PRL6_9MAGN